MRNILLLIAVITVVSGGLACGGAAGTSNKADAKVCPTISDTPTEAYKRLYAAVKAKNTESIKAEMSKKSQDLAASLAERQKKSIDEMYANGFTGTTFSPTLPEIRDERITSCTSGVEVRNTKDQRWEDLPFVNEDGKWKFGIGELFADSFKSPGKPQSTKEQEAVNAMHGGAPPPNMMANNNTLGMANVNATPAPKYTGPQVEPLPKRK